MATSQCRIISHSVARKFGYTDVASLLGAVPEHMRCVNTSDTDSGVFIDPERLHLFHNADGASYLTIVNSFLPTLVNDCIDRHAFVSQSIADTTAVAEIWGGTQDERDYVIDIPSKPYFSEPPFTRMGMSRSGSRGKGTGSAGRSLLDATVVKAIVDSQHLITDVSHLGLFVSGIGPDKLSDLITNVLAFSLCEFTASECTRFGKTYLLAKARVGGWDHGSHRYEIDRELSVLECNDEPWVLVPKYIVSKKPLARTRDLVRAAVLRWLESTFPQHAKTIRSDRLRSESPSLTPWLDRLQLPSGSEKQALVELMKAHQEIHGIVLSSTQSGRSDIDR